MPRSKALAADLDRARYRPVCSQTSFHIAPTFADSPGLWSVMQTCQTPSCHVALVGTLLCVLTQVVGKAMYISIGKTIVSSVPVITACGGGTPFRLKLFCIQSY